MAELPGPSRPAAAAAITTATLAVAAAITAATTAITSIAATIAASAVTAITTAAVAAVTTATAVATAAPSSATSPVAAATASMAAASATRAAPATSEAAAARLFASLVDHETAALKRVAVQGLDGRLCSLGRSHRDKAEAAGTAGFTISDDAGIGNFTMDPEQLGELGVGGPPGQIAHVDLGSHRVCKSSNRFEHCISGKTGAADREMQFPGPCRQDGP